MKLAIISTVDLDDKAIEILKNTATTAASDVYNDGRQDSLEWYRDYEKGMRNIHLKEVEVITIDKELVRELDECTTREEIQALLSYKIGDEIYRHLDIKEVEEDRAEQEPLAMVLNMPNIRNMITVMEEWNGFGVFLNDYGLTLHI